MAMSMPAKSNVLVKLIYLNFMSFEGLKRLSEHSFLFSIPRASYYEISVDDGPWEKQKSSGLNLCTGTGSKAW